MLYITIQVNPWKEDMITAERAQEIADEAISQWAWDSIGERIVTALSEGDERIAQ